MRFRLELLSRSILELRSEIGEEVEQKLKIEESGEQVLEQRSTSIIDDKEEC